MAKEEYITNDEFQALLMDSAFTPANQDFYIRYKCCYCDKVVMIEVYSDQSFNCPSCNGNLEEGFRLVGLRGNTVYYLDNGQKISE